MHLVLFLKLCGCLLATTSCKTDVGDLDAPRNIKLKRLKSLGAAGKRTLKLRQGFSILNFFQRKRRKIGANKD